MAGEIGSQVVEEAAVDTRSGQRATGDGTAESGSAMPSGFGNAAAPPGGSGLGVVRDIAVTLSIEVGRVRMTVAELMALGQGSVVELERLAEEPLDVFVNGTLVARGEAVVVGERFGIRLTEVVGEPSGARS